MILADPRIGNICISKNGHVFTLLAIDTEQNSFQYFLYRPEKNYQSFGWYPVVETKHGKKNVLDVVEELFSNVAFIGKK